MISDIFLKPEDYFIIMDVDKLVIQFNDLKREEEELRKKLDERDFKIQISKEEYRYYISEKRKELEYTQKNLEKLKNDFKYLKSKFSSVMKKELLEKLDRRLEDKPFEELITEDEFMRLLERYKNS